MRKRIIAFYDVLLFAIICSPMIVTAVILSFVLVTKGTSEWIYENWYLVLIFAILITKRVNWRELGSSPRGGDTMTNHEVTYVIIIVLLSVVTIIALVK